MPVKSFLFMSGKAGSALLGSPPLLLLLGARLGRHAPHQERNEDRPPPDEEEASDDHEHVSPLKSGAQEVDVRQAEEGRVPVDELDAPRSRRRPGVRPSLASPPPRLS